MSPENAKAMMPMIKVRSVDEARTFYVEKLGFHHQMGVLGKDGQLDFCNLTFGGASLMLTRAQEPLPPASNGQPVELYVHASDVDAHFKQVKAAGVKVSEPLIDQWWGDRTFVVTDPNEYRVWFFTTVGQPKPPAGTKIV